MSWKDADLAKVLQDVRKSHEASGDEPPKASPAAAALLANPFGGLGGGPQCAPFQRHPTFEMSAQEKSQMFARPGDWPCPNCGDNQYARNAFCRRCKTGRPASAGPAPRLEPGDWVCPICYDFQYKRNKDCRKCGTPKSAVDNQEEAARAAVRISTKDWTCYGCGAAQLPSTASCKNCHTKRPAMYTMAIEHQLSCFDTAQQNIAAGVDPSILGDIVFPEAAPPPLKFVAPKRAAKDWECPKCGSLNFEQCFMCRCGGQRPNPKKEGATASSETTAPSKRRLAAAPIVDEKEIEEKAAARAAKQQESAPLAYKLPGQKRRKTGKAKVDGDDKKESKASDPGGPKEADLFAEARKEPAKPLVDVDTMLAALLEDPPKPAARKETKPVAEDTAAEVVDVVAAPGSPGEDNSDDEKDDAVVGAGDDTQRKAALRDFWSFYVPSLQENQAQAVAPAPRAAAAIRNIQNTTPQQAAPAPAATSFLAMWQAEADRGAHRVPKPAPASPPTPEWNEEPSEEEDDAYDPEAAPANDDPPQPATWKSLTMI